MIERLQGWMEEAEVEVACLTNPSSIAYLTGFRSNPFERLMALVVSSDRAALLLPAIEEESARAQAPEIELKGWSDGDDPWEELARLTGHRLTGLAVEKDHLTLSGYEKLSSQVQFGRVSDISAPLRQWRAIKTPSELEKLSKAAQITDQLFDQLLAILQPGITELEVGIYLSELTAKFGTKPSFPTLVQFGPHSAEPHGVTSNQKLIPGQLILLDFGAAYQGYCADTTRMVVLGESDPKQREIHQIVLEAHDRAIEVVRPGVRAGEVDAAARSVITAAGYGEFFIHRVGHGLGLEPHEAPSLAPGSEVILEAGMVITIEPGIYLPGWGGVRIEDDLVVVEGGARKLTQSSCELKVIPLN